VGDVTGGLERANGGAALEAGLGRVKDGQCCLWGSSEAVMLSGVSLCRDLKAEASGEPEVFRDPLNEASDEVGRWAGSLTRLARGLARGSLARLSFVDLFL
jgi:hypothetical protein